MTLDSTARNITEESHVIFIDSDSTIKTIRDENDALKIKGEPQNSGNVVHITSEAIGPAGGIKTNTKNIGATRITSEIEAIISIESTSWAKFLTLVVFYHLYIDSRAPLQKKSSSSGVHPVKERTTEKTTQVVDPCKGFS